VAVIAIRRDDVVIFAQHTDRADGDRLLTAVLVKEAADLVPLLVEHLRPFLEAADQHHLAQPDQSLRAVNDRFGFSLNLHHDHPTPDRMCGWAVGTKRDWLGKSKTPLDLQGYVPAPSNCRRT
jgi:hypothetical protein